MADPTPFHFDAVQLSNTNAYWAGLIANAMVHLGMRQVVISPGSRSALLTYAFSHHPELEAFPVLDERSASFFALGLAKQFHRPVGLICTSGTAVSNYYSAVIEARYSHVPLIVMTADRPHELRECHSGQTIDQLGVFAGYPRFEAELDFPEEEEASIRRLFQTLIEGFSRSTSRNAGPIHYNIPFRDPLHPTEGAALQPLSDLSAIMEEERVAVSGDPGGLSPPPCPEGLNGLIVVGHASPGDPQAFCEAIGGLSKKLGYPVFADALSPLRNFSDSNPYLVCGYDTILRNKEIAEALAPETIIQVGSLPTSKLLRNWLETYKVITYQVDPSDDNRDPLNRPVTPIRLSIEGWVAQLEPVVRKTEYAWARIWQSLESQFQNKLQDAFWGCDRVFEGKIPWQLSKVLPAGTPVFIANSMPVRDAEYFWAPNNNHHPIYVNRGANGIDGTLSTAVGITHQQDHAVLLTGDLALLHDSNGFLLKPWFKGTLTILLINNGGGAIFENLPISQTRDGFKDFFLTPQSIKWQAFLHGHGVPLMQAETWEAFTALLMEEPRKPGIRVIEIQTDPQTDVPFRKRLLSELAAGLKLDVAES